MTTAATEHITGRQRDAGAEVAACAGTVVFEPAMEDGFGNRAVGGDRWRALDQLAEETITAGPA